MTFSRDEFEDVVDVARDYLRGSPADEPLLAEVPRVELDRMLDRQRERAALAKDFAEALVQLTDACVMGVSCTRHGGVVHGQEAEELRAGIEQILHNTDGVREDEAAFVLPELRKSLLFLLDHVDARDSLAFRQAAEPKDPAEENETSSCV